MRRSLLLYLVLALAAFIRPAAAQLEPGASAYQLEIWRFCIVGKVRQYFKTADSAEVVARVAALACRAERRKYLALEPSVQGDLTERFLVEDATVLVMELRAPK